MSSLSAIRLAIKDVIEAGIETLRAYDTVPEAIELPAVVVEPATSDFQVSMGRGTDQWIFKIIVLVSWSDSEIAQNALDEYVSGAGASSIRQVIFNTRTLGLPGTDAHISGMSEYGSGHPAAGVDHVAAVLDMVVYTTGTA